MEFRKVHWDLDLDTIAKATRNLQGKPAVVLICKSMMPSAHMSYSLNSLKGGYMGDYIGDYYRGY